MGRLRSELVLIGINHQGLLACETNKFDVALAPEKNTVRTVMYLDTAKVNISPCVLIDNK